MQEIKDPAITLFGKKIPFLGISDESGQSIEKERSCLDGDDGEISEKDSSSDKNSASAEKEEQESSNLQTSEANEDAGVSNPERTKSMEEETDSKSEKEQNDPNKANNSQDQSKPVLKKPDKILPCPRCNSMDTKFCYYNNYNINQPRHFCKACQRYWTAGGTMRNVPVGAGRRKNKNSSSSSHYQHISISEAIQAARIDASQNGMLKTNGRVLSFGLDAQHAPICNSMASVLKLGDQKVLNGATRNGFNYVGDQGNGFSCRMVENGNDCSGGPSTAMSNINLTDESGGRNCTVQETTAMNMNGFSPHIPCLPGIPWPYPWNSAIPPPGFFPMPFCPYWSVPVLSPQSSSSSHKGSSLTGPNSPTLGKHSREEDAGKLEEQPKQRNGSVLIPKTLRFDDPNEAAKSSIWATLGIKNDFLSKGGMFKGFEPKNNEKIKKNSAAETSPALSANPAALSRSLVFHERI